MKNALDNIRSRYTALMSGRYGTDELEGMLLIVWFALLVALGFCSTFGAIWWLQLGLSVLSAAVAAIAVFRFLSKSIFKRSAENDRFLRVRGRATEFFRLQKLRWKERKTHVYKKCPHCKKYMRVARVNGKHTVRCPMCGETFKVRISGGKTSK